MANGESKNWIRLMLTLEAFHVLYGRWPDTIRLYHFFIDELQEKLTPPDFIKLTSRIKLVPDEENPFTATDNTGNKFDYSREDQPKQNPAVKAIDWLDIKEPDYHD